MPGTDESKTEETVNDSSTVVDPKTAFDAWLKTQPTEVQEAYTAHVGGLTSALAKEREAAKGVSALKKQLAELQDAEEKRKQAEMTELDRVKQGLTKLTEERDALKSQLETKIIQHALTSAAVEANFVDPEDAVRMVPIEELEIADGKVTGVTEAIAKLVKAKAYLIRKPGGGLGNDFNKDGKKPRKSELPAGKPSIHL